MICFKQFIFNVKSNVIFYIQVKLSDMICFKQFIFVLFCFFSKNITIEVIFFVFVEQYKSLRWCLITRFGLYCACLYCTYFCLFLNKTSTIIEIPIFLFLFLVLFIHGFVQADEDDFVQADEDEDGLSMVSLHPWRCEIAFPNLSTDNRF
jgi:hypothetical protein